MDIYLPSMEAQRPTRGSNNADRVYQRTYKACIPCRQRKAKCELGTGPDGVSSGPPCARCRREQKKCVFTKKRAWERSKKRRASEDADISSPNTRQRRSSPDERNGSYDVMADHGPSPGNISTDTTAGDMDESGQERPQSTPSLGNSIMRTVVSSGNDALNILFEAAAAHSRGNGMEPDAQPRNNVSSESRAARNEIPWTGGDSAAPYHIVARTVYPVELSQASKEVLEVWEACRFVKMGWFTSREAVTLIDLFFKNMSPLSPILTDFYANHANTYWLLTRDPVLCSTILMISARYHILPGAGGESRNFFIHHRLWQHCQQLVTRLIFGQDKSTSSKIRNIGTIEALLLMSEWHPRSLHFPPEVDGWDCDLMTGTTEPRQNANQEDTSANRWLKDMIEPARRSDQMSWMLLGSSLSLAHELGIFEAGDEEPSRPSELEEPDQMKFRRQRVQRLLYVYINQLAWRIGCVSLMPQSLNHAIIRGQATRELSRSGDGWFTFMDSWMDLTKLAKSVSDTFFPSVAFARQQLNSGRYIDLLDHFRPLLTQWKEKYLQPQCKLLHDPIWIRSFGTYSDKHGLVLDKPFFNILFIEYHFVRVYTHSVGMQAVVERILADGEPNLEEVRPLNIDTIDYEYIQEVIDGCCQILEKVIQLAETGALRFSPVRIFLRITSSSIFLMKALSLGARQAKLRETLDILEKAIQGLKSNALDDIHLSSRYAILLDMHVSRLRRNLLVSSSKGTKHSRENTRTSPAGPSSWYDNNTTENRDMGAVDSTPMSQTMSDFTFIPSLNSMAADDWLSLPFTPSMAPFGTSTSGQIPALEGGALDFIWNLPS